MENLSPTQMEKVSNLELDTNHLFKIVFKRLDNLEEQLPSHPKERKRIGLKLGSK